MKKKTTLKAYTCNNTQSRRWVVLLPLWPIYMGERKTTFAKAFMGLNKKKVIFGTC
jgi:hypothetical protein